MALCLSLDTDGDFPAPAVAHTRHNHGLWCIPENLGEPLRKFESGSNGGHFRLRYAAPGSATPLAGQSSRARCRRAECQAQVSHRGAGVIWGLVP